MQTSMKSQALAVAALQQAPGVQSQTARTFAHVSADLTRMLKAK